MINQRSDIDVGFTYAIGFFGDCVGVVLSSRAAGDNHVCYASVVEDDGNWSLTEAGQLSTFWMPEMCQALEASGGLDARKLCR